MIPKQVSATLILKHRLINLVLNKDNTEDLLVVVHYRGETFQRGHLCLWMKIVIYSQKLKAPSMKMLIASIKNYLIDINIALDSR